MDDSGQAETPTVSGTALAVDVQEGINSKTSLEQYIQINHMNFILRPIISCNSQLIVSKWYSAVAKLMFGTKPSTPHEKQYPLGLAVALLIVDLTARFVCRG